MHESRVSARLLLHRTTGVPASKCETRRGSEARVMVACADRTGILAVIVPKGLAPIALMAQSLG